MTCPLKSLHEQFGIALHDHIYMGPSAKDSDKLESTKKKTIRLAEVFRVAHQQIETELNDNTCPDGKEFIHIKALQHDANLIYQRYEEATNSWIRIFLKCLARFTPDFLKSILPSCFSNHMEEAEIETKDEFDKLTKFLKDQLAHLKSKGPEKEEAAAEKKPAVKSKGDGKKEVATKKEPVQEDGKKKGATQKIDEEEIFDPDLDSVTDESEGEKGKSPKKVAHAKGDKPKGAQPKVNRPGGKRDPKTAPKPDPKAKPKVDPAKEKQLRELREKRLRALDSLFGKDSPPPRKLGGLEEEDPEMQKFLFEQLYASQKSLGNPKGSPKGDKKKDDADADTPGSSQQPKKEGVETPAPKSEEPDSVEQSKDEASPVSSPVSVTPIDPLTQKKIIEKVLSNIEKCLQLLNHSDKRPMTLAAFVNVIGNLVNAILALSAIGEEGQAALEKANVSEELITLLTSSDMKGALLSLNHGKISELLATTPWQDAFKEAMNQTGFIKFGIQKLGGMTVFKCISDKGTQVKESEFQKYRGHVKMGIADTKSLNELDGFIQFLDKYASCCPSKVTITLGKDQTLTPALVQMLLKLEKRVTQIEVEGLQEIDFKALGLTEAEELDFVRHLESFQFPNLNNIVLSEHDKDNWTANDFSNLLELCPRLELLALCFLYCTSYQDIVIPLALQKLEAVDFSLFETHHVSYLISQFPNLTHLDFSGSSITDDQLMECLKKLGLQNIRGLNLEHCNNLTTDILAFLATLPHLTTMTLPDLPKGKVALDKLPKFDNPFKVKLLYTTSKVTQPLASSFYTGPQIWSVIFQIPLARLGIKEIFPANQRRLDPKTVAYWLYQADYKHLDPQDGILTVLADSNADLNDDNIVEFMQKFPKALSLSLYNCPNVTDEGIIKLLKACPNIHTLDLTACPHITEVLLMGDGHLPTLKRMQKIIVTGTGIPEDIIEVFQEQGVKLDFETAILKVTDNDLTDDNALETMLKSRNLTKLKTIDLEGCQKLTDAMLGQLLDHLNAPLLIKRKDDDTFVDNPQRLNAAVINIRNCSNITETAFHQQVAKKGEAGEDETEEPKIDLKLLENLNRMVIGGTKIPTPLIQSLYPQVIFQETDDPVTIQIDPPLQLQECMDYYDKKGQAQLGEDEKQVLKRLTERFLHNRIVVELFPDNPDNVQEVLQHPVDPNDFRDLTLCFMTEEPDPAKPAAPVIFKAHKDVLYCQSLYFVNGFRPGGKMSKNNGIDILNVHATPKAAKAIVDLLYGKLNVNSLDWKTAADVAELIGPENFKLAKIFYEQLLKRIRSQFDLKQGHEILVAAKQLNDKEGMKEYEETLLVQLKNLDPSDQTTFLQIANLAKGHELTKLRAEVKKVEDAKTRKLIKQELDAQNKENEDLTREMLEDLADDHKSSFPWGFKLFGPGKKPAKKKPTQKTS